MTGDTFRVELHDDRCDVVVRVAGEVDIATAPALAATLDQAGARCSGDVRVDLAAVTFFDSAAIRALLLAHGALTERGRRLVLADLSPTVRRVFALAGLLTLFQTEADPEPH